MLLLRLAEVQNWELQTLRLSANTNTGINPLSASHSRRRIFHIHAHKNEPASHETGSSMAGAEGLEPSTKVLETHVLPLHHAPMRFVRIAGTGFSLAPFHPFVKRFCENCSELAENRPALYKTRGAWYDEGRKVGGRDARAVGGTGSGVCADAWRGVHAAPRG